MTKHIGKFISTLKNMSPQAYYILKGGLILSILLLVPALILLLKNGEFNLDTYKAYNMISELYNTAAAILLVVVIGSVCVEDSVKK